MVNLEWYRTFKAVYQTGSLTAASKILFISQPNVSQHLSALEAHVGKQLFERKPRLVSTDYGKLFYTQIVESLEKLEAVESAFKAICNSPKLPSLRIGTVKEYFQAVLSKSLMEVPAELLISFGLTKELISRLIKGELDFVIATQKADDKNLVYEPVFEETFVIAGSIGIDTAAFNKLVKGKDWKLVEDWLLNQTWFAYSSDLAMIRRFWLKNFKKRPAIRPHFVIPDMHVILNALGSSTGLTITADYLLNEMLVENKLKLIWKGQIPTDNTLYLVYDRAKVTAQQLKLARMLLKDGSARIPSQV
ncbi:LysR family transcriptional regulator [Pedobacter petrophilus]